jgi:nitrogen fixation NifU-like protein
MDNIYREELMAHYKNPHNRGILDDATHETVKKNEMCGDLISMQLKVEDGKIKDVKFDGHGCAVSIASSSILTEELKGKTIEEAKKMNKDKLLALLGVELTTSRIKCATLPLEALQGLLGVYD